MDERKERKNKMGQLPQDPRDHYASLEEFCASEGADCEEIVKKLRDVDYEYDPETNSFV